MVLGCCVYMLIRNIPKEPGSLHNLEAVTVEANNRSYSAWNFQHLS
jgi:hypothetical protein